MTYGFLLFDFDHTLFDTTASEREAFVALMGGLGVDDPLAVLPDYQGINQRLWRAAERGEIRPEEIAEIRFGEFNELIGLGADPVLMAATFKGLLGACGDLYPGVAGLLTAWSSTASLALVTNAISEVQRARLARLGIDHHFDVIAISTEIGAVKPHVDFFDKVFEQLGHPPRHEMLMIGDSLTSDIAGGVAAGIDTCWYNPVGSDRPDGAASPTYTIDSLAHLDRIIGFVAS